MSMRDAFPLTSAKLFVRAVRHWVNAPPRRACREEAEPALHRIPADHLALVLRMPSCAHRRVRAEQRLKIKVRLHRCRVRAGGNATAAAPKRRTEDALGVSER